MESDTRCRWFGGGPAAAWHLRNMLGAGERVGGRKGVKIRESFWSCKEGGSVRVGRAETSRVENKIQAESFAS